MSEELHEARELNELAWGLIANASGGDWERESEQWRRAAARWRDRWHKTLPVHSDKEDQ
jgi:hypothetical protein